MKVKCRLDRILREKGIYTHGVIKDIADATGASRHTIARLLNGQASTVSLDLLGLISDWLINEMGYPPEYLPQQLIGVDALWDHVRSSTRVLIYVGEYEQSTPRRLARSVIARQDAQVATSIVRQLALHALGNRMEVDINYVKSRYAGLESSAIRAEDRKYAEKLFKEMRDRETDLGRTTVFLVGSQRINPLVEHLVAACFGCAPFTSTPSLRVPFYLLYRQLDDPSVPSCFGGRNPPHDFRGKSVPGIYYRTGKGWRLCPYVENLEDAGIVIVTSQPARQALEVAIFGFSSAGTGAVGKYFLENPQMFWPPVAELFGRQVGVFICRVLDVKSGSCKVEPLSKAMLTRLASRR